MTRLDQFLARYVGRLIETYTWAANPEKLTRYLASVRESLTTNRRTWNHHGECVSAAWRDIGERGHPTYKQLRALAEEEAP